MGVDLDRYQIRRGNGDGVPARLPKGRYLEEEYAELERQRLWPSTWQLACLTSDVAEPGDWFEYRMGDRAGSGPPPEMIHFPEGTVIAEVVNQDLDGIGRVQAGMASNGIQELLLGDFDRRLVNMHAELDRVMAVADKGSRQ